jgi:sialate O-acetylesterase
VGERLALWALAHDYGKQDLIFSGPLYKSLRCTADHAIVQFDYAEGLKTSDGKPPTHFQIAGSDGKFAPADAKISGKTITLSAATVHDPTSVRFGWSETAMPNLINGAGLPASPFKSEP